MSNTRYAKPGSEPSDDRYASDPLLTTGIKSGDVMRRCGTLKDPVLIELAFFLQYVSNQPGSLEKLATDLLDAFPERIGTPSLLALKLKPDAILTANQVRAVRDESPFCKEMFLLRGEISDMTLAGHWQHIPDRNEDYLDRLARQKREKEAQLEREEKERQASLKRPTTCPASEFIDRCREAFIDGVPEILHQFCVNPGFTPAQVRVDGFHDLLGALIVYLDVWEKKTLDGLVITELGAKVLETLNYAESQRCLSLAEGFARMGKSFITEAWAKARPGRRRIVSLSEATSDKEFFREIAKALAATAGFGLKTNELRERVTAILRAGFLTLVIDEAHFLWPQRNLREASPRRIEWVRASLANYGVPVAMIATHQFTRSQQQLEKNSNWASEQFIGRIAFSPKLPDRLGAKDIEAVARFHLPEADEQAIKFLVNYVIISKKHLASIDHGVKAARHEARKHGRQRVTYQDVMEGFSNTVLPTDQNLARAAEAAETPAKGRRKGQSKVFAVPVQTTEQTISKPVPEQEPDKILVTTSDRPLRSMASPSAA